MDTATVDLIDRKSHPLRKQLTAEMHVRLFPAFKAPARLCQFLTLSDEKGADADRAHADELCRHYGVTPPENGRYFVVRLGDMDFVWERHTEFTTWTFIRQDPIAEPFAESLAAALPDGWIDDLPGTIFRGTEIDVLDRNTPEPSEEVLSRLFSQTDLVSCEVNSGEARVWSDFRLHKESIGRLLIHDRGLVGRDTSRLVQRLQDLGNYRKIALLGLPLAQSYTPRVSELERRLAHLSSEIAGSREKDEELLEELSALTAELSKISAETSYRMSATRAYANIVSDRLGELDVRRVRGFQTLTDFTERRLTPAVRTCEVLYPAARRPVAARVLGLEPDAHAHRHRARAPEPGPSGLDEPAGADPNPPSGNGGRPVDCGHQLLFGGPYRLSGQSSRSRRNDDRPEIDHGCQRAPGDSCDLAGPATCAQTHRP